MEFRDVSRQMGLKPSGLQNAIDRNLTIGTLRKIAEAINAINEENKRADRCYLAEFFADELPAGFTLASTATEEAAPQPATVSAPATSEQGQQGGEQKAADALPFGESQQEPKRESVPGVVVCPHCKGHFVAEISFKASE